MADYTQRMRKILRDEIPEIYFFTDEDLDFYVNENAGDVNAALYQCLLVRAENSEVSLPGFSATDTSSYFRRRAQKYRPSQSKLL